MKKLENLLALSDRLQEVSLTILDDEECKFLTHRNGSQVRVNIDLELCAGKKNFIPKYPVYTRVVNHTRASRIWSNRKCDGSDLIFVRRLCSLRPHTRTKSPPLKEIMSLEEKKVVFRQTGARFS